MPTSERLLALAAELASKDVAPYVDEVNDQPLIATAPSKGSIVATKTIDELGVHEWTLSNGARVVLKPTDFETDEIHFAAFSPGGTSLASDAEFDHADAADVIVGAAGVAGLVPTQRCKRLAGIVVAVMPVIG
jgi:zinc protease